MEKYDFSGWATRNDLQCSDGRIIRKDAFKHNDGLTVPLVWNHDHTDPFRVIGHALLENREEGVYTYGKFNDTELGKTAKIYVSVLGDEQAQADAVKGLKSAAPFLRGKLAKSLNLRNTPQLFFTVDQSIEYGVRMSRLIDEEIAKIPEREEEEVATEDDEW